MTPRTSPNARTVDAGWLGFWVLCCAYLSFAGWMLSAIHQLNQSGYLVALLLGMGGWLWWRGSAGLPLLPPLRAQRTLRRFRRWLPLGFLALAALAFLGGVLHAPANYDALAYRTPRVLHWLAEERWHWIPTEFHRLNTRGCAMEWVTAPLLLFFKSDRPLFLINFISYLLLPGLFYGLLTRLGVRRRVAWHWMWVLPTGYCYLLQAASIANDLFSATLALTAVVLALKARRPEDHRLAWLSVFAAALLSSAKAINLPLGLPWLVALAPGWRALTARPLKTALVCVAAATISFVPTAVLNQLNAGEIMGTRIERINTLGLAGNFKYNVATLLLEHTAPPIMPAADRINARLFGKDSLLSINELQTEEGAGLGSPLAILLLVGFLWSLLGIGPTKSPGITPDSRKLGWAVFLGALVSVAVVLPIPFVASVPRYLSPFYPFLIFPLLFAFRQGAFYRRWWWRGGLLLVFGLSAVLLIVNPARPLFAPAFILPRLGDLGLPQRIQMRAESVYATYAARPRVFDQVLAELPPGAEGLGLVTFDQPETALWKPFGQRRMVHLPASDTASSVRARSLRYALVSEDALTYVFMMSFEEWRRRYEARLIKTYEITLRAQRGPEKWYLVEFLDAVGAEQGSRYEVAAEGPP